MAFHSIDLPWLYRIGRRGDLVVLALLVGFGSASRRWSSDGEFCGRYCEHHVTMRLILSFFSLVLVGRSRSRNGIVSTSPSITETLFALGAGSRVVGVSNIAAIPKQFSNFRRSEPS